VERFCRVDVRNLGLTLSLYKLLDENKEYRCSLYSLPPFQSAWIECTPRSYPGSPPP
jgi:hypothetical protein